MLAIGLSPMRCVSVACSASATSASPIHLYYNRTTTCNFYFSVVNTCTVQFLQRCISHDRFCPTVRPSVTVRYHAKTTPATILRSSLGDSPMTLAGTNMDDLECPIYLKVRVTDGTLDVRTLWLSDSSRPWHRCRAEGSGLEGLPPLHVGS